LVSATAHDAAGRAGATRLGFKTGQVVQELGYDGDVDHDLRDAIEDVVGSELLDEDADDVVDAVLLWWREDDGDLVDALVDAVTPLADTGTVWLLTPKAARPGYVEASEIEEAASTAGLHPTTSVSACRDWAGTRLAARGRR
jgi:hypothetical protein